MNRTNFFANLKKSTSIFKGKFTQSQVNGINSILDACVKYNVANPHHIAHILAHVYHETGKYMSPIKETVYGTSTNKNPTDSIVIKRLNTAWAKGQLSWVSTPYWKDGWFGRGQIQITHKNNYDKLGKKIGVDLVSNPSLALDINNSAAIAVLGMRDGDFTGKKLSDYAFPQALDADWQNHPRRIVNGKDGTDVNIKKYHLSFYTALIDAGYKATTPKPTVTIAPSATSPSAPTQTANEFVIAPKISHNFVEALIAILKQLFKGK